LTSVHVPRIDVVVDEPPGPDPPGPDPPGPDPPPLTVDGAQLLTPRTIIAAAPIAIAAARVRRAGEKRLVVTVVPLR